ncbi:MAG: hypothetical protein SVV67_00520 [Bacillota bacterium]|nr:hypothetical protein [Bacillota bacterium]
MYISHREDLDRPALFYVIIKLPIIKNKYLAVTDIPVNIGFPRERGGT